MEKLPPTNKQQRNIFCVGALSSGSGNKPAKVHVSGAWGLGRAVLGGLCSQWLLVSIIDVQHCGGSSIHTFTRDLEASQRVCEHQCWLHQPCPASS